MSLYRMELDDEFGEPYYRDASPAEILAAARPHADLKNDKVLDWMEIHLGRYDWETALAVVQQLFDAALGGTDE